MKSIINFFKDSNHYLHTILCAIIALIYCSIGAFVFSNFWYSALFAVSTVLICGITIESYQYYLSKSLDLKNSILDLSADLIGGIGGIIIYGLLTLFSPTSAIILMILSALSVICAFVLKDRYLFIGIFLLCLIVGFSLFIFA